jgi:hypothetical protein
VGSVEFDIGCGRKAKSMNIPTTSMTTNMFKVLGGAALAVASCAALAQPAIKVNGDPTLTFASTPVLVTNSTPTPSTITLENTGTEKLTITGVEKSGANATDFAATGTCVGASVTVNPGATCTIGATFTPPYAGSLSATFTVQSNAATNPSITVSGIGAAVTTPNIILSAPSIAFNTQTVGEASAPRQITVTNNSNSTMPVSISLVTTAPNTEFASTTDCVGNLAAGDVCSISITFTPAMEGARTGTVTITAPNVSGSPRTVALSGPGVTVSAGAARLGESALSFPATPTGVTATVMKTKLTNTGNAPLSLTAIALSGANAAEFASSGGTTCAVGAAGMLAVDASCDLEVNFTPQSAGGKSASLVVTHDAGAGATSIVMLSGTGTARPPPPAPPPSSTPTPPPAAVSPPTAQAKDGGGGALDPELGLLLLVPALASRARRSRLDC